MIKRKKNVVCLYTGLRRKPSLCRKTFVFLQTEKKTKTVIEVEDTNYQIL